MEIIFVIDTRPNFLKIAPFIRAIEVYNEKPFDYASTPLTASAQGNTDKIEWSFSIKQLSET